MKIDIMPGVGLLFVLLAIFFVIRSMVGSPKTGQERAIARRTRLRLALIFAIVGMGLNVLHAFLR
jgi:hypothetical protein